LGRRTASLLGDVLEAGLGAQLAVGHVEEVRPSGNLPEGLLRVNVSDGVVGVLVHGAIS